MSSGRRYRRNRGEGEHTIDDASCVDTFPTRGDKCQASLFSAGVEAHHVTEKNARSGRSSTVREEAGVKTTNLVLRPKLNLRAVLGTNLPAQGSDGKKKRAAALVRQEGPGPPPIAEPHQYKSGHFQYKAGHICRQRKVSL